jgi:hypothetical protein
VRFLPTFWFDPESEVSSVEWGAPGTVGGWMTVLMKSRGRLTGLSRILAFAFIFVTVSERKANFWFSTWACFLKHMAYAGIFVLKYYNLFIII